MTNEPARPSVLVVYESMFGNTAMVAEAIAAGLRAVGRRVELRTASAAPTELDGFDLVVVGGPTHAWSMSRSRTRAAARDQGATNADDVGVREWLASVRRPTTTVRAASFDTRARSRFAGSAGRGILRRLRGLGLRGDQRFHAVVSGVSGPLAEGELERARRWATTLPAAASPAQRADR